MVETRKKIIDTVKENPGIGFTQLKEITDLTNGVLQYHIHRSSELEKEKGAIVTSETCSNCDLRQKCREKCLKKMLRKPKNKKIMKMKEKGMKNIEIANKIGLAESTVSYHLSKMEEAGLTTIDPDLRFEL